MVKVTAPLFSLGASGSVGKSIVYASWKGRNYVRQLVIPSNPQTGGQVGNRAMFTFQTQAWFALSTANKATWETLADQYTISTHNAYIKRNMKNWSTFGSPSYEDPATETGTPATLTTFTATGGVREVVLDLDLTALDDNWGVCVFRSTTSSFTPSITNMVFAKLLVTTDPIQIVDTPLDPDTYYYDAKCFSNDGVFGTLKGEINATAT